MPPRPRLRRRNTVTRDSGEIADGRDGSVGHEPVTAAGSSDLSVWSRDGIRLDADAGGPLRFVPPPTLWAYKGVKWAGRIELVNRFVAGFWESRIDDPEGHIPEEVLRP